MKLSIKHQIALVIGVPVVIIFAVTFLLSFYQLYQQAKYAVMQETEEIAGQHAALFNADLREAALAAKLAKVNAENQDVLTAAEISTILRSNLRNDEWIFGSAMAFEPYQYQKDVKLYAPYVYRQNKELVELDIAKVAYDYTSGEWEWWEKPRATLQSSWGNAYLGKSVGVLMVTYSVPLVKHEKFWGVVTVDISLSQLRTLVSNKVKKDMDFFIINSEGRYVYHPDTDAIKNKTVFAEKEIKDSDEMLSVVNLVKSGQTGTLILPAWGAQKNVWLYYTPLDAAQAWYFVVVLPEQQILQPLNSIFIESVLTAVIGLIFILFYVWMLADFILRQLQLSKENPASFIKNFLHSFIPFIIILLFVSSLFYWAKTVEHSEYDVLNYLRDISDITFIILLTSITMTLIFYAAMKSAYAQLNTEKNYSNQLLSYILPRELIKKFRSENTLPVENFSKASVLVVEVVNASSFESLNDVFNKFDALLEKFSVEKIKTFNNIYMVASGVPHPCDDHATRLAALAFEMLQHTDSIRIGIHSGPVTAGFTGSIKTGYDLFGDTVSIAQRLTLSAELGKIHVSQPVQELLKFDYNLLPQEPLLEEGREGMKTYYLLGKLKEIPNA